MLYGIDISSANGIDPATGKRVPIDAKKIAAAGKSFAYLKATDGVTYVDGMFFQNARILAQEAIVLGAYHYLHVRVGRAGDYPEQARQFCDAMIRAGMGCVDGTPAGAPPWVDCEPTNNDGASSSQWLDAIGTFEATVVSEIGRSCMLYTYPSFWIGLGAAGASSPCAASMRLAIAHYVGERAPSVPKPWTDAADEVLHGATMHQYAADVGSVGTCDGILGHVDLDRFNGTVDDLLAL